MNQTYGRLLIRTIFILFIAACRRESVALSEETTVRSTAVVDLSFDQVEGPAEDAAVGGNAQDTATPMNEPSRIASPFWNVRGGQAVRFDASQTQYFQIAHSEDLNHKNGTTLSFYFLNLHDLSDATFHGIVAKRNEQNTNYGLNYQPLSGKLQVYVHDGTGYKVAAFPIAEAFGVRRLVHLSATFRRADAPDPDADADEDDLEIRLYVNGKALAPLDAPGGTVSGESGWFTDVNFDGLVNESPLTIGSSYPNGEPFSGLIDEFLLFERALSSEEASRLFSEVAGPDGERLARLEREAAPSVLPVITELSPRALQIGATTRLTITGQNLAEEATVWLPGIEATTTVLPNSTAESLVVDVAVKEDELPILVPLAVRTKNGISASSPLPVDRLPQRLLGEAVGETVELPMALSGVFEGAQRPSVLITGKAGQRLVVEVESKRLGGGADPVLELKTEDGSLLEVAWGESQLGGDARLVTTFPRDGRFRVELHDLAYKAPRSPVRLLLGELSIVDAIIPSAAESSRRGVAKAVGIGLDQQSVEVNTQVDESLASLSGPAIKDAQIVLPAVLVSDGRELNEEDVAESAVDLTGPDRRPVYVTGELAEGRESDRFRLRVKPAQRITVRVDCRSLGSAVEPVLAAFENGEQIGRQMSAPGTGRATLSVTPKGTDIELRISNRFASGEKNRLYRLRLASAGTPSLRVTCLDTSIVVPQSGRGIARFRIEKEGRIEEVRLVPDAASGVVIEPSVVRLLKGTQDVFVTVSALPGREIGASLRITAEGEISDGVLRREVEMTSDPAVARYRSGRPYFSVPLVVKAAAPSLELVRLPSAALKGVTDSLGLRVGGELPPNHVARFSLVTDEPTRPVDPKKPEAGSKAKVRILEDLTVPSGMEDVVVPIAVPADVDVAELSAVVKVEVVPHAWSQHVTAVGYSSPFRLAVQTAVLETEIVGSASIRPGENEVKFVVQRREGFRQPVRLELRGLPEGFSATAVDLAAEQSEANLKIVVPPGVSAGPTAAAELVVLNSKGELLFQKKPISLEVVP